MSRPGRDKHVFHTPTPVGVCHYEGAGMAHPDKDDMWHGCDRCCHL